MNPIRVKVLLLHFIVLKTMHDSYKLTDFMNECSQNSLVNSCLWTQVTYD